MWFNEYPVDSEREDKQAAAKKRYDNFTKSKASKKRTHKRGKR